VQINRQELCHIIGARVEEIFGLLLQEIKRSGYDGLLPAGMVLTGGASLLPGIRTVASRILGMPVRIAQPEKLFGMVDKLYSPAYSTGVGLLKWALLMSEFAPQKSRRSRHYASTQGNESGVINWDSVKNFFRRLLP
jgi:cell division protein FtsA